MLPFDHVGIVELPPPPPPSCRPLLLPLLPHRGGVFYKVYSGFGECAVEQSIPILPAKPHIMHVRYICYHCTRAPNELARSGEGGREGGGR